jgi:hypothetical protein
MLLNKIVKGSKNETSWSNPYIDAQSLLLSYDRKTATGINKEVLSRNCPVLISLKRQSIHYAEPPGSDVFVLQ